MATAADTATRPDNGVVVLLIDDQPIVAESVRRMLAGEPDVKFHYCQDPSKAIATANEVKPTVILQDLVMPEIDGLMLVKFFRANKATRDVPMIVLSSKEEPAVKAQAFANGANDYLVKLPDKLEVVARIRYHSKGYVALMERNAAYAALRESQEHLAAEIAGASRYVQSMLPEPLRKGAEIHGKFVPCATLGGDLFGYNWIDKRHLAMFLLDVSGHGVSSSLLAVSAASALSAQSLAGADFRKPAVVLEKLNDYFQMDRQDGKYFTIFYAVFDAEERTLTYSNGGHPDALLYTGESAAAGELIQLPSTDTLIGMLPPGMEFGEKTVKLGPYAHLLVYSDGAFEIEPPGGPMWEFADFVSYVRDLFKTGDPLREALYAKAREMRQGDMLADDYSLLEARL